MATIERETKLQLAASDFDRLLSTSRSLRTIEQLNVYYDSEEKLSTARSTFRVRLTAGRPPLATLKLPLGTYAGMRESIEIEEIVNPPTDCASMHGRWLVVDSDLPEIFSEALGRLGIERLRRLGWMRNTRRVVTLPQGRVPIELDQTWLPDGTVHYEAEIEADDPDVHVRSVLQVRELVGSALPSEMSKYERFALALRRAGAGFPDPVHTAPAG